MKKIFLIVSLIASLGVAAEPEYGNNSGENSIAIGKNSVAEVKDGVAIGEGAGVVYEGTAGIAGIAIGKNAKSHLMAGAHHEAIVNLGRDKDKMTGGIAIGTDTHARISTIDIGNRDYVGKIGDIDFNKTSAVNTWNYTQAVGATTVGDNSINAGNFGTINGAFNIISTTTENGNSFHNLGKALQGFGSSITGTLNAIEGNNPLVGANPGSGISGIFEKIAIASGTKPPATGLMYSGTASQIVGIANKISKSNGSLIFGAGNQILNSYITPTGANQVISSTASSFINSNYKGPGIKELADSFSKYMTSARLGSVGIVGGANLADFALFSNISGVGNTLEGKGGITLDETNTKLNINEIYDKFSAFNSVNGYENKAKDVDHVVIQGSHNEIKHAEKSILIGDNQILKGTEDNRAKGNIIIGNRDTKDQNAIKESAKNIVALGDNIVAQTNNSVYLGSESKNAEADNSKGMSAYTSETISGNTYNFAGGTPAGLLSVGSKDKERRIQNVASGLLSATSTDAINGSQLYSIFTTLQNNISKTPVIKYFSVKSTGGNNENNDGAKGENSIAIGKNAIAYNNSAISIGEGALVDSSGNDSSDGIAIGKNARALRPNGFFHIPNSTKGIAVGRNTFASESSIDIGAKSVSSQDEGANRRGSTTVGAESYAGAHFSSIYGSYSKIETGTVKFSPIPLFSSIGVATQGFGSSVNGSINKIKANADKQPFDGVASYINGFGNVSEKSNGTLIIGAGNKVSNALVNDFAIKNSILNYSKLIDAEYVNELLNKETSNGDKTYLGSVGVIGGQNIVDYALLSNIQGVNNKLIGTENNLSTLASINGYKNRANNVTKLMLEGTNNKVNNVENTYIKGSDNVITNVSNSIVMGTNQNLVGTDSDKASGNILFGFNTNLTNNIKTSAKDIVTIGNNIVANTDNSVYLGSESKDAETNNSKGKEVYAGDTLFGKDLTFAGGTPSGIVSVGSKDKERRIQNVAAGLVSENSTDAINGSQLYSVISNFGNATSVSLGDLKKDIEKNTKVTNAGIASAMALANVPQVADYNHRHLVGFGAATYGKEFGFAVGYSGVNKAENLLFKVNASINTRGNYGVGVGMGYMFGETKEKSELSEIKKNIEALSNNSKLNGLEDKVAKMIEAQKSNEYIKGLEDKIVKLEQKINNSPTKIIIEDGNQDEINKLKEKITNLEVSVKSGEIKRKGKKIPISCSTVGQHCIIRGFQVDARKPSAEELDDLKQIVNILNTYYDSKVIDVIGFTDSTGSAEYNLELGLDRATTIVNYLQKLGLSKNIVVRRVASRGENEIVSTNKTAYGRYQNRRVELYFYDK